MSAGSGTIACSIINVSWEIVSSHSAGKPRLARLANGAGKSTHGGGRGGDGGAASGQHVNAPCPRFAHDRRHCWSMNSALFSHSPAWAQSGHISAYAVPSSPMPLETGV